ncbi:MAG: Hpt domain-containing protein [Cyanobacteria bacterium P01_A01_bin.114]
MTMIEDEELRNLYRTAGTEHLQTLEAGLHHLANQPDDSTVIETLRKAAHSIKGDSKVMGLEEIACLAEQIEARMKQIQRAELTLTDKLSTLISEGVQMIDQLINVAVTGESAELDSQPLLEQLKHPMADSALPSPAPALIAVTSDLNGGQAEGALTGKPLGSDGLTGEPIEEQSLASEPFAVEALTGEPAAQAVEENTLTAAPEAGKALAETSAAHTSIAHDSVAHDSVTHDVEAYLTPELIADEELRSLYQVTTASRLQKLTWGLAQIEPPQAPPDKALVELRRELHALKGDSQILGVTSVATLAKQMESTLKAIGREEQPLTLEIHAQMQADLALIDQWVSQATQTPTTAAASPSASLLIDEGVASNFPTSSLFIEDVELRDIYQLTSLERLENLRDSLGQLMASPSAVEIEPTETELAEPAEPAEPAELDPDLGPDLTTTQAPATPVLSAEQRTSAIETLRREAHSLTADSHVVGLDPVAQVTRQFEVTVKRVQQHLLELTPSLLAQLDQSLDSIQRLVQEAVTGTPSGVDQAQVLALLVAAADVSASETHASPGLADDIEFREIYKATSEDRLQRLETGLLQLATQPEDTAILAELMREAHSLKGDARAADIDTVEALAHALEDILGGLQRREMVFTPDLCDSLYRGLDAIAQSVQSFTSGTLSQLDTQQVMVEIMESALTSRNEIAPEPLPEADTIPFIQDDALLEIYTLTSKERLSKLEAGLAHLEAHPEEASTTLTALLREAHSLKGDSGSAGVDQVAALTHAIETIFGGLQRQAIVLTPELSDRLYEGFDTIAQLVDQAGLDTPAPIDSQQILSQLRAAAPDTAAPAPITPTPTPTPPLQRPPDPYKIDTIRVQTSDLDVLMGRSEQLTVTRIQITQATAQIKEVANLWEEWKNQRGQSAQANPYEESLDSLIGTLRRTAQENSNKLELITEELSERIRVLRLLPLSSLFQTLPRTVRDLARQQNKQVELVLSGQETTADKRILEGIRDALMHLVRNAIDHGIESSKERVAAGKSPTATIGIKGYQTPNSIVIEVTDDGQGLDLEQIKQTAIRRRLYSAEELEGMSAKQIQELILSPGFSTRTFITEISGRGVGLDVVRNNVERLQGNIQIDSLPGQGCTFRLQVSTSLTTANVVLVETLGVVHALPIEFLQTTLMVSPDQMIIGDSNQITIQWNDQIVPIANLFDVLELSASAAKNTTPIPSNRRPCLLLKVGDSLGGFFIDRLLDTQEVVLKPQGALLKRVRNVTGATILGNGDVCMILNPPDLVKSLQRPTPSAPLPDENLRTKPLLLLVEDSPPVRTQEKRLFEGAGYDVVIAEDGLEGYKLLRDGQFDVVVSDVEMPNLDGLSLTAKIRQHPEYEDLPIILVTTLSSDEDRKRGADAGADAYIPKGKFNQDVLLETLARLV